MLDRTWAGADDVVRLEDRRRISVRRYGDPSGYPVLMLHGTPGARLKFVGTEAPAKRLRLAIVAPDRWAYGGTDAPPTPSLRAFAAEFAAVMDRLGHQRFAVAGVSGGAPYATALACLHPERVSATALVSPVGLVAESVANGEVGAFHRFCFGPLADRPRAVAAIFALYAAAVRQVPALACRLTTLRAPRADRAIMSDGDTSARLLATFQEGLSRSARGPAIDLALFRELAGLELRRADGPARVWIGTRDTNVPVAAARRLAEALPRATLTELAGEGHLWVARHYDDVLGWIAATVTPASPAPAARR